ncbi:uncharacterized protein BJ212DRAFT_1446953 [Suillus subaureus]|uniref:Uncharacterized protein n=1 Tax=Suillus subaureus TaxID=48587 RepID=A0A9P7EB67_9AGAM|nr:uncharacterized protein BJ212DRAFT_1446953 [Suillus subaureus]KAG1816438.1 hypothetical protein BJ212DRAFT_1446953 [Suillus subaureus]
MWTGHWWHAVQDRLPEGASVAPVIIATDKTQLTRFSASKSAYLVYLMLGNIPRAIHCKSSQHACILIGVQRLFHDSIQIILELLKDAGRRGIEVVGGDGLVHLVFPILACYVVDYPEQCLVTCTKYGTCPKCRARADELAEIQSFARHTQPWTSAIIDHANISTKTDSAFCKQCMSQDHMVEWCQELMDEEELDQRLRTLPPCYGVYQFYKGWSALGQVGGKERKHMARVLLACLIGKVLQDFHLHKDVIINLGIRDHLNIPKFHSLQHYLENI